MTDDSQKREPASKPSRAAGDSWPARLAKRLLPNSGKSGVGASGAMAQLKEDRLTAAKTAWSTEDQIRTLWRARAPAQRTLAGVRELQDWVGGNAPELLPVGEDSHRYLLLVLSGEIQDAGSDPAKER